MVESSDDAASAIVSVAPPVVFRFPATIPVVRTPHIAETLGSSAAGGEKRSLLQLIEKDVPAHCDQHGDYLTEVLRIGAGPGIRKACPQCAAADEAKRATEAEAERVAAQQRFADRALGSSGLPRRFRECSIEGFQVSSDSDRRAVAVATKFVAEFAAKPGACLVFIGGVGVGKTHLASAIVRALALQGFAAGYSTAIEILQTLRATWQKHSPETEGQVLSRLQRLDLLVVDEVGRTFGTEAEQVQFFEVFNRRYREQKSTIIISNLDLGGIEAALGEAVFDRFRQDATVVQFAGVSRRAMMRDAA